MAGSMEFEITPRDAAGVRAQLSGLGQLTTIDRKLPALSRIVDAITINLCVGTAAISAEELSEGASLALKAAKEITSISARLNGSEQLDAQELLKRCLQKGVEFVVASVNKNLSQSTSVITSSVETLLSTAKGIIDLPLSSGATELAESYYLGLLSGVLDLSSPPTDTSFTNDSNNSHLLGRFKIATSLMGTPGFIENFSGAALSLPLTWMSYSIESRINTTVRSLRGIEPFSKNLDTTRGTSEELEAVRIFGDGVKAIARRIGNSPSEFIGIATRCQSLCDCCVNEGLHFRGPLHLLRIAEFLGDNLPVDYGDTVVGSIRSKARAISISALDGAAGGVDIQTGFLKPAPRRVGDALFYASIVASLLKDPSILTETWDKEERKLTEYAEKAGADPILLKEGRNLLTCALEGVGNLGDSLLDGPVTKQFLAACQSIQQTISNLPT